MLDSLDADCGRDCVVALLVHGAVGSWSNALRIA